MKLDSFAMQAKNIVNICKSGYFKTMKKVGWVSVLMIYIVIKFFRFLYLLRLAL